MISFGKHRYGPLRERKYRETRREWKERVKQEYVRDVCVVRMTVSSAVPSHPPDYEKGWAKRVWFCETVVRKKAQSGRRPRVRREGEGGEGECHPPLRSHPPLLLLDPIVVML